MSACVNDAYLNIKINIKVKINYLKNQLPKASYNDPKIKNIKAPISCEELFTLIKIRRIFPTEH